MLLGAFMRKFGYLCPFVCALLGYHTLLFGFLALAFVEDYC
jgi:hypothetical protein